MINSLSGRFLMLTVIFVMLAEILIFLPSVARYREDYLTNRLERAQIASLTLLAEDMITAELERELLENAGVLNVVLRRNEVRQLILSSPIPAPIDATYDLRDPGAFVLIRDALTILWDQDMQVIRVIGDPVQEAGLLIEVTMMADPLRAAIIDYGIRILVLSAVISAMTAFLLFLAVRYVLVVPINRVIRHMLSYAEAPEDARRIIVPTAGIRELRAAEDALQSLQTQLTGSLRQKERLAQLGQAVAKVSHDLRNILTTAQLFADRVEASEDPAVRRVGPKLVASISRAVNLTESTLAFGKAEEPPPALAMVPLRRLAEDVVESELLACSDGSEIDILCDVPAPMSVRADGEQLHRVLSNLVRNARQALESRESGGTIVVTARESETGWSIEVADDGPGLPKAAQDRLFQPFASGSRRGTGLGLAIAMDLIRGHGGTLKLCETGAEGTRFAIDLPKTLLGELPTPS